MPWSMHACRPECMTLKPRKRPGRRAVIDMRTIMERCANIYGAAGCLRFLDEQASALWGYLTYLHQHWSPGSMLVDRSGHIFSWVHCGDCAVHRCQCYMGEIRCTVNIDALATESQLISFMWPRDSALINACLFAGERIHRASQRCTCGDGHCMVHDAALPQASETFRPLPSTLSGPGNLSQSIFTRFVPVFSEHAQADTDFQVHPIV